MVPVIVEKCIDAVENTGEYIDRQGSESKVYIYI